MLKRFMAGVYALAFLATPVIITDGWWPFLALIPGSLLLVYAVLGDVDLLD